MAQRWVKAVMIEPGYDHVSILYIILSKFSSHACQRSQTVDRFIHIYMTKAVQSISNPDA
jgi:hypothetical protein